MNVYNLPPSPQNKMDDLKHLLEQKFTCGKPLTIFLLCMIAIGRHDDHDDLNIFLFLIGPLADALKVQNAPYLYSWKIENALKER